MMITKMFCSVDHIWEMQSTKFKAMRTYRTNIFCLVTMIKSIYLNMDIVGYDIFKNLINNDTKRTLAICLTITLIRKKRNKRKQIIISKPTKKSCKKVWRLLQKSEKTEFFTNYYYKRKKLLNELVDRAEN